jgi:FkbM family methyltransferase
MDWSKKVIRASRLAAAILPPPIGMRIIAYCEFLVGEPELRILRKLIPADEDALDVGGSEGHYTFFISKFARRCYTFEANVNSARVIKARVPHATIIDLALSASAGTAELRTPITGSTGLLEGWATIEPSNNLDAVGVHSVQTRTVQTRALDSFAFNNVGFVKIDVEGHELSVLQGGREFLKNNLPYILVECSEDNRMGAFESITKFLAEFEYDWFENRRGRFAKLGSNRPTQTQNILFIPRRRPIGRQPAPIGLSSDIQ